MRRRECCRRVGAVVGAVTLGGRARADSEWWRERTTITGEPDQLVGFGLGLDGDRALVGVPLAGDPDGTATAPPDVTTGAVIVSRRTDSGWERETRLTPGPESGDLFGARVAIDGDRAVVGAPGTGEAVGTATVFRRTDGEWRREATLTPSDGAGGDQFGNALAVAGDEVLIGAPGTDVGPADGPKTVIDGGAVYVFEQNDGWRERAKLTAPDAGMSERFGSAVETDGSRALIGAPTLSRRNAGGSVAVFARTADRWEHRQTIFASHEGVIGRPGSVALDGETAVLGAAQTRSDGLARHSVRVLRRRADGWEPTATLRPDADDHGDFGRAVAVSDGRLFVGAPGSASRNGRDAGAVYVFRRTGDGWRRLGRFAAPDATNDEQFGWPVVADRDRLLVGATFGGSAHLFERVGEPPETATPRPATRPGTTATESPGFSPVTGTLAALAGVEVIRRVRDRTDR